MSRAIRALLGLTILLSACGGEVEPTATFTGDRCDYQGPSAFELDSTVTFTFVNDSSVTDMGFSVWPIPDTTTAQEIFDEGLFAVVGDDDTYSFYDAVFPPTETGSTSSLDVTFDRSGSHAIICFDVSGIGADRDYAILFDVE